MCEIIRKQIIFLFNMRGAAAHGSRTGNVCRAKQQLGRLQKPATPSSAGQELTPVLQLSTYVSDKENATNIHVVFTILNFLFGFSDTNLLTA